MSESEGDRQPQLTMKRVIEEQVINLPSLYCVLRNQQNKDIKR